MGSRAASCAFVVVAGVAVCVVPVEAVADEAGLPVDVLLPHAANTSRNSRPKSIVKDV